MSAFVRGQLVLVERDAESYEDGWNNTWEDDMDGAVGRIGRVLERGDLARDVRLSVPGLYDRGYPEFVLTPVSQGPISNEDWDRFSREDL